LGGGGSGVGGDGSASPNGSAGADGVAAGGGGGGDAAGQSGRGEAGSENGDGGDGDDNTKRQNLVESLIGMGFPIDWAIRAAEQAMEASTFVSCCSVLQFFFLFQTAHMYLSCI
jgi:hypothetical protein